ncbi:MAG: hypothetical protein AAFX90_21560 [Pseudomonadota bacterium]
MIDNYVQNLSIDDLDRGGADSIAKFLFNLWKETGGEMPDETSPIVEYLPQLVILETISNATDSPDVIHVGTDTLFAKLLPQAADPKMPQPRLEIEPHYRNLVRQSYVDASKGEARYDVIGFTYLLPNGLEWLKTERVLLPFTASSGLRWIYCYSILREARKIKPQPDPKDRRESSPLPLDRHQLLMEDVTS